MRLQFGNTGVNPIACIGGDFDQDDSFTLNDASHVAEAQFNSAFLPWEEGFSGGRKLEKKAGHSAVIPSLMTLHNLSSEVRTVQVFVQRADGSRGMWKALSAQFRVSTSAARIETVQMLQGAPGQIVAMHGDSFFHAADLSGAGLAWPMGPVAKVTFAPGTNMGSLQIDYRSTNTYLVQRADASCRPAAGAPCEIVTAMSTLSDPSASAPNAATNATTDAHVPEGPASLQAEAHKEIPLQAASLPLTRLGAMVACIVPAVGALTAMAVIRLREKRRVAKMLPA